MTTATKRTVIQNYSTEELADMFTNHSGMADKYWAALGRLSWWGGDSPSHCYVDIYMDAESGILSGVYKASLTGEATFVLAAVWDEGNGCFSFNS